MADRDEQRPLVDRLDDLLVALADDDLEVGLGLVEVAHGREVLRARRRPGCARGSTGRKQESTIASAIGDVLVHHRRARPGADDPPDLVADLERHRPPALAPGADPARPPRPGRTRRAASSAAAGIAPSEWLIRYVVSARIGKRSRKRAAIGQA